MSSQEVESAYELGLRAARAEMYEEAYEIWKPIAENGHAVAQLNLAILCLSGLHGERQTELAFHWIEKAKNSGIPEIREAVEVIEKLDDVEVFRSMLVFG